jgi:UDP-glucose 4-epimerase
MKAFVTGGAGFIGSHLVRRLLKSQSTESVVVYDNFTSGRRLYLQDLTNDRRLSVVEADLKDAGAVRESVEGCDTIFHLAANPDIAKAITQPDIDFWEGTYLTQNVLEAMRQTGATQLFYTSGSGVYGEDPTVDFPENHGPCIPISTYGASKLASESLIAAYCHMFDLVARVFRFANVVGPRQTHGVGYDFIRRLKNDATALRMLGDGTQKKSYIHVDDVLEAIFIVAAKAIKPYEVFNVATDDYVTVRQIADLAVAIAGLRREEIRYDFTGGDRGWKGDVPIVRFDCAKIKALGWRNRRSSVEALSDAMEAMRREIESG